MTLDSVTPSARACQLGTLCNKDARLVEIVLGESRGVVRARRDVLIVEDNDEVLAVASEILTSAGYRVTTAISGEQGLKTFDKVHPDNHIDLLFTDLVMPGGMNGLMLADAVMERDPSVSVLLTTGYNEELVVNGPRKRATDVLSKPYRRTELLDRVRQALNHAVNRAAIAQSMYFGLAEEAKSIVPPAR